MRVVAAFLFAAFPLGLLALDLRIEPAENALRTALTRVASVDGGKITFTASSAAVDVKDRIELRGPGVVLDAETRNIPFRYASPDDCSQKEGQDPLMCTGPEAMTRSEEQDLRSCLKTALFAGGAPPPLKAKSNSSWRKRAKERIRAR